MKVLLICYECSPYAGSEWAVGWGRLLGASQVAETHVITSAANYVHLQRAAQEGLIPPNVRFHTPPPDIKLQKLERHAGLFAYNYKAYNYWHRLALYLARELHAAEQFDIAHQVNVCTFREPGYGAELGIPFIWGPFGGSQNFPMSFLTTLSWKEALKEGGRSLANHLALRKPRVRMAAGKAALVFGANSTNQRDFEKAFGRRVELLLETGLHAFPEPDRSRFVERVSRRHLGLPTAPLRLLWSGELHTRKALPVLLRALAQLPQNISWTLDVLGSGPMEAGWQAQAKRLGLSARTRFLGRQSFADAVAAMNGADLFCFTSLRDTSGNVVLEALAAGVPVLCFDHQGAGDMVDRSCGVKFGVGRPAQAYRDWSRAVAELVADPQRLLALSHGATRRAEQFLWSENHKRINGYYQDLTVQPAPLADRIGDRALQERSEVLQR